MIDLLFPASSMSSETISAGAMHLPITTFQNVTASQSSKTAVFSPHGAVTFPSDVTHEKPEKAEITGTCDVVTATDTGMCDKHGYKHRAA